MSGHLVRVYNHHLDGYGHVNNARYLEFLEEARWHFFHQQMALMPLMHMNLVVVHMDIRYARAAVRDDVLSIESHIVRAQSRQITVQQHIRLSQNQGLVVAARVSLAPTQTGKVVRLSSETLANVCALVKDIS